MGDPLWRVPPGWAAAAMSEASFVPNQAPGVAVGAHGRRPKVQAAAPTSRRTLRTTRTEGGLSTAVRLVPGCRAPEPRRGAPESRRIGGTRPGVRRPRSWSLEGPFEGPFEWVSRAWVRGSEGPLLLCGALLVSRPRSPEAPRPARRAMNKIARALVGDSTDSQEVENRHGESSQKSRRHPSILRKNSTG